LVTLGSGELIPADTADQWSGSVYIPPSLGDWWVNRAWGTAYTVTGTPAGIAIETVNGAKMGSNVPVTAGVWTPLNLGSVFDKNGMRRQISTNIYDPNRVIQLVGTTAAASTLAHIQATVELIPLPNPQPDEFLPRQLENAGQSIKHPAWGAMAQLLKLRGVTDLNLALQQILVNDKPYESSTMQLLCVGPDNQDTSGTDVILGEAYCPGDFDGGDDLGHNWTLVEAWVMMNDISGNVTARINIDGWDAVYAGAPTGNLVQGVWTKMPIDLNTKIYAGDRLDLEGTTVGSMNHACAVFVIKPNFDMTDGR
jgi:hypothetical protein